MNFLSDCIIWIIDKSVSVFLWSLLIVPVGGVFYVSYSYYTYNERSQKRQCKMYCPKPQALVVKRYDSSHNDCYCLINGTWELKAVVK